MTSVQINPESHVQFCTLSIQQEDEDFIVGRTDTSTYIQLPDIGVKIIHQLNQGATIAEVSEILKQEYGEEVSVAEFVNDLIENRLVHKVDDHILEVQKKEQGHFEKIPLEKLSWLYSSQMFILYGLILLIICGIILVHPQYFPKSGDFFPFKSYAKCILVSFFMSTLTLFIHEFSHLAAARSIGVSGRISLSNRLIFLVAQTDISNVWNQPRNKRYIPYLAGMAVDIVQVFIWLLVLLIRDTYFPSQLSFIYGIAKQQVLAIFLSSIWQFRFYMQTDIYYVITNFLKCRNLINDTQQYLLNFIRKITGRIKVNLGLKPAEQRIVQFFTLFYIGGVIITLYTFFSFTLPILIQGFSGSIINIRSGFDSNFGKFIDGAVFLVIFGLQYSLLIYVIGKRYLANFQFPFLKASKTNSIETT